MCDFDVFVIFCELYGVCDSRFMVYAVVMADGERRSFGRKSRAMVT